MQINVQPNVKLFQELPTIPDQGVKPVSGSDGANEVYKQIWERELKLYA